MIKIITDETDNEILDKMVKAANYALDREGLNSDNLNMEVCLSLVDKDEIHRLNKEFRSIDSQTDVLSFPQFENVAEIQGFNRINPDMPIELGDVVICTEIAKKQGEDYGHGYQREVVYLFVHSILHLLGYDHMEDDDKKKMRQVEKEIMKHIDLTK